MQIEQFSLTSRLQASRKQSGTEKGDRDGSVLRCLARVVIQQAAEPLAALHGFVCPAHFGSRINQPIRKALMVALPMIMLQELVDGVS